LTGTEYETELDATLLEFACDTQTSASQPAKLRNVGMLTAAVISRVMPAGRSRYG